MSTISWSNSLGGAGEAIASFLGIMVVEKGAMAREGVKRGREISLLDSLGAAGHESGTPRRKLLRSRARLKEDIARLCIRQTRSGEYVVLVAGTKIDERDGWKLENNVT